MSTELTTTELDRISDLTDALLAAKKDRSERDVILSKIMDFFRENKIKTYRHGDIVIRFTDERTTNQFDVDMLRMKYPEIWTECHANHVRPAHLAIKKIPVKEDPDDNEEPEDED